MGFLDFFRNNGEIETLKGLVGELKDLLRQEREKIIYLEEQNKELNEKLFELLKERIEENKNNKQKEHEKEYFKPKLTPKEKDVLGVIENSVGMSNKEIAEILHITPGSLNVYKNKLKNKGYL